MTASRVKQMMFAVIGYSGCQLRKILSTSSSEFLSNEKPVSFCITTIIIVIYLPFMCSSFSSLGTSHTTKNSRIMSSRRAAVIGQLLRTSKRWSMDNNTLGISFMQLLHKLIDSPLFKWPRSKNWHCRSLPCSWFWAAGSQDVNMSETALTTPSDETNGTSARAAISLVYSKVLAGSR